MNFARRLKMMSAAGIGMAVWIGIPLRYLAAGLAVKIICGAAAYVIILRRKNTGWIWPGAGP